jgi:hypothetical protein
VTLEADPVERRSCREEARGEGERRVELRVVAFEQDLVHEEPR